MNRRTFLISSLVAIGAIVVFPKTTLAVSNKRKLIHFNALVKVLKEEGLKDFYIADFYLRQKVRNGIVILEVDENYLIYAETKTGGKYAAIPLENTFHCSNEELAKETGYFKKIPLGEKL